MGGIPAIDDPEDEEERGVVEDRADRADEQGEAGDLRTASLSQRAASSTAAET